MIRVKQYLNNNFFIMIEPESFQKDDGHYYVRGTWGYPRKMAKDILESSKKQSFIGNNKIVVDNYIGCSCHDETIQIHIVIDGETINEQNIFSTSNEINYDNLAKSTEDEIIEYIDKYYNIFNKRRIEKISKLKILINEKT